MLLATTSRTDSYLQFLTILLLFVFVLFITFLTTRWIAGYQKSRMQGGNLEVIETTRITSNKYLQLVRAGEKYLLIGVGKDEIHMLAELSKEELILTERSGTIQADFSSILENVRKRKNQEKE